MKPTITRCPTCHRKHTRTHPQNARYWLLLHQIAERLKPLETQYSAETWHEYFKSKFLPKIETNLPNGKTAVKQVSTADLSVDEFGDYMTQVEAFASKRGVWLEDIAA